MIFFRHLKIALVIMLIFVPAYLGQNYYEILGVARNADQKEIKKSFRNLAKKHHPDKAQESQQTDQMEKINVAYETLSDPKKRKEYDHELTYGRSDYGGYGRGDFGFGRNKYYDDVFGRRQQDFSGYNNYYSGGGYSSPFDLKGLFSKLVQFFYDLFFTSKVQEQTFFEMQTNSQLVIGILTMGIHGLVGFLYRKIKKISS